VEKEMWRERVRKKIRNGAPEMAGDIFEISRELSDVIYREGEGIRAPFAYYFNN